MVVNEEKIKEDVIGPITEVYILEFPNLTSEIREYAKKPNCGICRQKFLNGLYATANHVEALKLIYGPHTELDIRKPASPVVPMPNNQQRNASPMHPQVHRIPIDEYDEWVQTNVKGMVRMFNAFYIPEEKIVVVTMQGMSGR